MRITCPHCGERDRREFTVQGDDTALARPDRDAGGEAWHAYVHLRDNQPGRVREMWYHDPCQAWLIVTRDTVSHAILGTEPAREAAR